MYIVEDTEKKIPKVCMLAIGFCSNFLYKSEVMY